MTNDHPGLTLSDYQPEQDRMPDQRPTIGVVVALWSPDLSEHAAHEMHELIVVTLETIRELGARPILIDSSASNQQAVGTGWHSEVDGIVYLGGADVHPGLYDEVPLSKQLPGIDVNADQFCVASVQRAVADDVPVLAICRGAQLLNVASGGTLIEHIDGHRSELADGNTGFINEQLKLEPNAMITEILGRTSVDVRGSHHQSIDALGEDLAVTAYAQDGTIEGIEHQSKSWIVGLQWHPEEPNANAEDRRRIFSTLIEQAR